MWFMTKRSLWLCEECGVALFRGPPSVVLMSMGVGLDCSCGSTEWGCGGTDRRGATLGGGPNKTCYRLSVDCGEGVHNMDNCYFWPGKLRVPLPGMENTRALVYCGGIRKSSLWDTLSQEMVNWCMFFESRSGYCVETREGWASVRQSNSPGWASAGTEKKLLRARDKAGGASAENLQAHKGFKLFISMKWATMVGLWAWWELTKGLLLWRAGYRVELPDLANKNTECQVKFKCEINANNFVGKYSRVVSGIYFS